MMFELSLKVDGWPKLRNPFKSVSKSGLPMDKQGIDLQNFTFTTTTSGLIQFFSGKDKTGEEYFKTCPPLSTIMFRKSVAYSQGKVELCKLNAKGEEEELPKTDAAWKTYLNPNPLQTGDQFKAALKGIMEIYGFAMVLKSVPEGFDSVKNPRGQYWILPPDQLFVKWNYNYLFTNDIKDCIDSIEFIGGLNSRLPIPKEDVYIFTDLTFSVGSQVVPQSRLFSVKDVLNNIIVNYESKGMLLANRGAQGIFTDDSKDRVGSTPLGQGQIEQLQKELGKYGLAKNQFKYIITGAQLRFEKITDTPKDLMMSEFMKEDVESLCVAMGFKYALLFDSDGSTFNNQNQYKKSLYTDNLIPESINFDRQLNEMYGLHTTDKYFKTCWDDLLVLMEDKKLEAEIDRIELSNYLTQFKNNLINYDRLLEEMDLQEGSKQLLGKFWIDLTPEQRAVFDGSHTTTSQNNANQNQGGSK